MMDTDALTTVAKTKSHWLTAACVAGLIAFAVLLVFGTANLMLNWAMRPHLDAMREIATNVSLGETKGRMEADLTAQQEMAKAAWAMFWTSLASTLIASGGVIAVVHTLLDNKKGLDLAHENLDEMRRQNEISQRLTRAYLTVSEVNFKFSTYAMTIELKITNVGQTPATQIGVTGAVSASKEITSLLTQTSDLVTEAGYAHVGTLFAGQVTPVRMQIRYPEHADSPQPTRLLGMMMAPFALRPTGLDDWEIVTFTCDLNFKDIYNDDRRETPPTFRKQDGNSIGFEGQFET